MKSFFNTRGQIYRELGLKVILRCLGPEEQFAILVSDGLLVKWPLLVGDEFVLVGVGHKVWDEALLRPQG